MAGINIPVGSPLAAKIYGAAVFAGVQMAPGFMNHFIKPKFNTNGHTAALIPVYAFGPRAELFSGIYENTAIYHKMREALGWELTALPKQISGGK